MDDRQPDATEALSPGPLPPSPPRRPLPRWLALLQTLLISGIPTQVLVAVILARVVGMPFDPADLSFEFFVALTVVDTVLVLVLLQIFLATSGEPASTVFLGARPWRREALRGVLLLPVVFVAVTVVVVIVRALAPWMHNVEQNPLQKYMDTPARAAIFLVIVMIGGGVREELQRAFILHRFEQRLGGAVLGLLLFSAAFGLLHINQGYDSAAAIGMLGLLWGTIYLRRRSVIAPMVNHASFNATQVLQGVLMKALGN